MTKKLVKSQWVRGGGSGDSIEEKRNDKGGAKHQKQPPHSKKKISIFFTLAVFS